MHTPGVTLGRRERNAGTTICISGLSDREKKTTLQEALGDYGHIVRIEIPPGRRVAFVEYEEKRDATEAMTAMDGKKIGESSVTIRFADDRPPPGAQPRQPPRRAGEVLLDQRGVRREEQVVRQMQAEAEAAASRPGSRSSGRGRSSSRGRRRGGRRRSRGRSRRSGGGRPRRSSRARSRSSRGGSRRGGRRSRGRRRRSG
ncbi:unnamed protein product [Prorocentrum cordatum]|uniref:RRM domain-containing protein n=1 Tax=Prorocentrum cordatum TaxID=2364126 RepID=A0ABN9TWG6_9DINO|nr:unnamed protein product [Polarella glacialis]